LGSGVTSHVYTSAPSRVQAQFPQNERKKVIIKSLFRPGPEWRSLPVAFVVSELSGQRTETGAADRFWVWEPAC
jgi:hypothetical protein